MLVFAEPTSSGSPGAAAPSAAPSAAASTGSPTAVPLPCSSTYWTSLRFTPARSVGAPQHGLLRGCGWAR